MTDTERHCSDEDATSGGSAESIDLLAAGIASAAAVVGYRLSEAIVSLLIVFTGPTTDRFIAYQALIRLVLGPALALGVGLAAYRTLASRSRAVKAVTLLILLLLALAPLQLRAESRQELVSAPPMDPGRPEPVKPVRIEMRFIDGLRIEEQVILDNADIARARPAPGRDEGRYGVALELTPAAAERMRRLTRDNVGKQLGIWRDDDLWRSPRIRAAISSHLALFDCMDHAEAARFARGIMNYADPRDE